MTKFTLTSYKSLNGALSAVKISEIIRLNGARTFIETGTYLGDTVSAMRDVFERIYSIELSAELHQQAIRRFANDKKVTLLLGDSSEKLREAARLSADPAAIFWLDAHWSGGNTARAIENTPIVSELKSIQSSQLIRSIVMIDDLRYFIDIPVGFDVHEANYGYPLLRELLKYVRELLPTHTPLISGDLLFIFPEQIYKGLEVSDAIQAINRLRLGDGDQGARRVDEAKVASAQGDERETIMALPETFKHSLNYGIGGDYLYWRGLVHENDGALESAKSDFQFARRCGVQIPPRNWE